MVLPFNHIHLRRVKITQIKSRTILRRDLARQRHTHIGPFDSILHHARAAQVGAVRQYPKREMFEALPIDQEIRQDVIPNLIDEFSVYVTDHILDRANSYQLVSSFAFSAIFLTATLNPANGFPSVAITTSSASGAMRAILRRRRERKHSSTFSFFIAEKRNIVFGCLIHVPDVDVSADFITRGDTSDRDAVVLGVDAWLIGFVVWVGHVDTSQLLRDYGVNVGLGIGVDSASIGKLGQTA